MADVAPPASFNFADVWEMAADALRRPRWRSCAATQRRTYAELEERANRLAHHLLALGVQPGRPRRASTSRTAPSTSRRCWPASSSGPCRSTSTTATSPDELRYLLDNADVVGRAPRPAAGRASLAAVLPDAAARAAGRSATGDGLRRRARRRARPTGRSVAERSATTATSSTRAAPPACPRASCGARRTRSTPASAAATRCGCEGEVDVARRAARRASATAASPTWRSRR